MEDRSGRGSSGEPSIRERNIFENVREVSADAPDEGTSGEANAATLTRPRAPAAHSSRRKSHKCYLATWGAQIAFDGFAKCLIKTCNFISLDIRKMQDHYKTCNGVPNNNFNFCNSCSCWLSTRKELMVHEFRCRLKKREALARESNNSDTNEPVPGCSYSSGESSAGMSNKERLMNYCDECNVEFSSDSDFSQHLLCKKNMPGTSQGSEKKDASTPGPSTSQQTVGSAQPGQPANQGECVRRRSFTKQHKTSWDSALRRHKYVKCVFKNCHFLALSVDDMIQHYGSCNGDGSFAKFVCPFCGGRLTTKKLLDIHIRRSHATEGIDDINFPCIAISNQDPEPPRVSRENYSSGKETIRFAGFDPNVPPEAPVEVEIVTEPTSFNLQENAPAEESVSVQEVAESDDPRQKKKSNSDPRTQAVGTGSGNSEESGDDVCGEESSVEGYSLVDDDDFENYSADAPEENAENNRQPRETSNVKGNKSDHIYSKAKIRKVCESESADSLSVKKKTTLKHYPSKKSPGETSSRVKSEDKVEVMTETQTDPGETSSRVKSENKVEAMTETQTDPGETTSRVKSEDKVEVMTETQTDPGETSSRVKSEDKLEVMTETQTDSGASVVVDESEKAARESPVSSFPATQGTVKRDVLSHYSVMWAQSLKANGYARCLVATCNFISLDVLHMRNHFKNCNGVPRNGPNFCTFCEGRLPSSVELEIHKTKCQANRKDQPSTSGTSQSSGGCRFGSCCGNRTGESSKAGEKESRVELNEYENDIWEEFDSAASDAEGTGDVVFAETKKSKSLRIAELMRLKNQEVLNIDRIIQTAPGLPKGQYLRRRSYSRTHRDAWQAALDKHKYVKCLFQNCHFLAMSLEDMIYHFGYCVGNGSFAKFECPHCGGRVTTKAVLDIHIERSHTDKSPNEGDEKMSESEYGETEVRLDSLNDLKKLIGNKEVKTYTSNARKVSIVVLDPDEGEEDEVCLGDFAPPTRKRKIKVDESSDVNNSTSGSVNNACGSSAEKKTRTNNDDEDTYPELETSEARNPREELHSDKGDGKETRENSGNATNSVSATGKEKTEELAEMTGEGDIPQGTSCNEGTSKSVSKTKENPTTPEKQNDEERDFQGNQESPEKPNDEQKPSKRNEKTLEKVNDEEKPSDGTEKNPEKPNDEEKPSKGNQRTPGKPNDDDKHSHGTPKTTRKPDDEEKPSKGNQKTSGKSNDNGSHGTERTSEKSNDNGKRSNGNHRTSGKSNDDEKRSHGNHRTSGKSNDGGQGSREADKNPEKSNDGGKRSHGAERSPEKPNDEKKRSKGNPKSPGKPEGNPNNSQKPNNERKSSKGSPKRREKPNDEEETEGILKTPEKLNDEEKPSVVTLKTPEKPFDGKKPSKGNPKSPEEPEGNSKIPPRPKDEQKPLKGNPKSPDKLNDEEKRSHGTARSFEKPKGNRRTSEKLNDEQNPHGNTNTSPLVLEKNSNTKKQETEKERISLRQNTKTGNKNSNKNDQETKHDIRLRSKRGRSWKSLSQEDLSEEEHVKEVLGNTDAEGTIHEASDSDGSQKPRAKFPKIEPPKSESNPEETRNPPNPPIRKRGRPPKRPSLRCKVSNAEEEVEPAKRGRSAKKGKSEPEGKLSTNKVICANCSFECERRLFTDHNYRKHAGLSWIEGENPINLNDEDAVSKSIKQAFKHIKSATCGKCGSVKKSALGFISHVQNCGKSEEEKAALKVKCPHCPARILKYSLPMHLKLSHFESEGKKPLQESVSFGDLPSKRKSALRAVNKFCEVLRQEDDEEETKKKGQFVVYEKGVSKLPKLPSKTRSLWMKMIKEKKRIPCRRGSCLIESSTIQEAKNHHFQCSELPHKCYVCERCDFFSESKTAIQQHVDIHTTVDADYKLGSEEDKSEEEADMKYADDDESDLMQYKSKGFGTSVEDGTLEASLKARFFAREGLMNERQMRFCRRSLRMTLESDMEEVKKYSPVFPQLYTQVSDWIPVKPENATHHFPSLDESISFRVDNTKKKSQSNWMKIKRFKADIVEGLAVIFTGGSILSMSWCKYSSLRSSKHNPKQYLAVSSSKKMEKFQNIHDEHGNSPSLIQIYSCGEMKIFNDVVEVPQMVMGIVHDYGEVWDLAWFPLDAYKHSDSDTVSTRIGLLGAACQDGTIKIWPICDPDELKPKYSLPLYKIHPKVILELEDKANVGCLRLAIGRTGTIVGGYAGGLVAVWNLKTIGSPFCKTDGIASVLKPIFSFQAHKTSITALSMCQNSDRYITTSGLDRFIKFWDLEYPGNPFENLQKEVCLDNVWPKHWPLTISTFEDIVPSSGKGMIKAIREVYCDKHRSPLALEGTCWSLSFNEWLNILCGCNNIGEVKVRFLRNMFLADETLRYRTGHVVSETELQFLKDLDYEKVEENVDGESSKGKSKKTAKSGIQTEEITAVPRTYDEAWKYFGLIIHDFAIEDDMKHKNTPTKTSKKGNQCLEDYPVTSVTKVSWNPNYRQFMHLAIGHHSGLITIKPLRDSKSNGDVTRFLTESDREIGKLVLD